MKVSVSIQLADTYTNKAMELFDLPLVQTYTVRLSTNPFFNTLTNICKQVGDCQHDQDRSL